MIFIALFHVLGHADHKNDFYLIFINFFNFTYFFYFFPNMPQNPGGGQFCTPIWYVNLYLYETLFLSINFCQ